MKTTPIMTIDSFDYEIIKKCKVEKGKRGQHGSLHKDKRKFVEMVCAFDIEASTIYLLDGVAVEEKQIHNLKQKEKDRLDIQAFMYVWQFQVGEHATVMGRTWEEYLTFCNRLSEALGSDRKLCIFVHNLSYEFQFLRGVYPFTSDDIFAIDRRKILKCVMFSNLEYRCSYLQTNMSLAEFTKKMDVEHKKLDGDLDYKIVRYADTPLTEEEIAYCQNDVTGLVEAIQFEMKSDGDTLQTIPLTSTGYVRRDCKKAMHAYRHMIQDIFPTLDTYTLCREAFRGGDVHANRFYVGMEVRDVKSADRSSSYPDVMINCKFPVTKFKKINNADIQIIDDMISRRKKAILMRVAFSDIALENEYNGCPYLSKSKCRNVEGEVIDNGRILKAEYLETTLTDIDWEIVKKEYDFSDIVVIEAEYANYGKLPYRLREVIQGYYNRKTELKGVVGEEVFYMKSKNKLNSIYGMTAQNPVIETLFYDGWQFFYDPDESVESLLEQAKNSAFMVYQWAVWTTALARYWLRQGIWAVGEDFIYCDTDSVKYIKDHDEDFKKLNEKIEAVSKENKAYAVDPKGVIHYMGVYENDDSYYKFKTLGAKKYIYNFKEDGDIHITIAGVRKSFGGKELEAHGGFQAFREGFIFYEAGGANIIYNDHKEAITLSYQDRKLVLTSNAAIVESTYKVSLTDDYRNIIEKSQKLLTAVKRYNILNTGSKITRKQRKGDLKHEE